MVSSLGSCHRNCLTAEDTERQRSQRRPGTTYFCRGSEISGPLYSDNLVTPAKQASPTDSSSLRRGAPTVGRSTSTGRPVFATFTSVCVSPPTTIVSPSATNISLSTLCFGNTAPTSLVWN